ncbi:MAG: hypothetical protein B7Z57_07915 [Acidiphilium sp. 37-60-79]|nr:MAG: hypothetical protein B7Z57_07915 [Acidiphilium sp. 37-60-79]
MASDINTHAQSLADRLSGILSLLRQILGTHEQSRAIELISLLSENPSLGRVLRPICHMLRIPLPLHLKLARKPEKPRKPRPPRPRRPKPEQKPPLTLLEHLLQKYPPAPPHPTLPGHRYAFSPPFKNRA